MIKLFACDLDGTLLNEYHEFDDIIFDMMDKVIKDEDIFHLRQAGICILSKARS